MPQPVSLSPAILAVAKRMEEFEAEASRRNTGTGSRREGAGFERLVSELWLEMRRRAVDLGADYSVVAGAGRRRWARLAHSSRVLYLPCARATPVSDASAPPTRWLEVDFSVNEMISRYPTEPVAISRYSPSTGPFAGGKYPGMFSGLRTSFDDTVVLEDAGVLREKILLEYKTAKSSKKRQLDANVHERLSFQMMQYLEAATRYTRCCFVVLANGAFIRYRNKYHVNFHVQADRLANFAWFSMEHASSSAEYCRFLAGLLSWLFHGTPRGQGSAP